jgi:hypothetical protein
MRRYKRKGGSSAAPVQQLKTNVSPTQTISGSITNTYDSTKDTIRSISNYITENFIFVLIAGCLLIFYLYLFSTDPVSQQDIDSNVEKIKCDSDRGYKGSCPAGKKVSPTIECTNNECTKDECCINEVNCSTYTSTCPTDKPTINRENICETDTCTNTDCCVKNCKRFSLCGSTQLLNPANLCEGDDCAVSECCEEQRTCLISDGDSMPYNCEIYGKILKSAAGGIDCPVGGCDDELCCRELESTNPTCGSWDCIDKRKKASAATRLCSEGTDGNCSHDYCCKD